MRTIDNVETLDDYSAALTIEQDNAQTLLLVVANASVRVRLRPSRRPSGGDESYGAELLYTPQSTPILGVSGLKVRSAIAGTPARVVAVLSAPDEPQLTAGVPFTGTLSGGGGLTPAPTGGAMQVIADQLLGAPAAAIDFPNISQAFAHLKLICHLRTTTAVVSDPIGVQLNGDAAGNYRHQLLRALAGAVSSAFTNGATSIRVGEAPGASTAAGVASVLEILIPNYTNLSFVQSLLGHSVGIDPTALTGFLNLAGGHRASGAAIDRVTLVSQGGGNFAAGSRATLYGISA